MSLSLRTWVELIGTAVLTAVVGWLLIVNANLKTDVANQKTAVQTAQLKVQAADASYASCKLAQAAVSDAVDMVRNQTMLSNAQTTKALQAAQDRAPVTAREITRLLSVRAPEGQDCPVANKLAQSAWEDGQ